MCAFDSRKPEVPLRTRSLRGTRTSFVCQLPTEIRAEAAYRTILETHLDDVRLHDKEIHTHTAYL
jgi:hypothetical protein